MTKMIIKVDNNDINWMNAFNVYFDSVFVIGQEIESEDIEWFQTKAHFFNNQIACGPAISLEVTDE